MEGPFAVNLHEWGLFNYACGFAGNGAGRQAAPTNKESTTKANGVQTVEGFPTKFADTHDRAIEASSLAKPMEVTVKLRLLLTSALFLFAQIATMHAQETVDLAKITCEQLAGEQLPWPSHDVVLLLSGYYKGKRNTTIVEPLTIKQNEGKVNSYCLQHGETTVMDAAKNVLGFDK